MSQSISAGLPRRALIPSGSGMRLPRSSTLVQRILNGAHATLTQVLGTGNVQVS
jgi:hypothetical protein